MIYGYARVSSIGQAKDGNSLESQTLALRERGCTEIYADTYTGTTTDRPELSKILGKIKKGDILVVTKLDRFSRSAAEGAALIKKLHAEGVIIDIINMGRADDTSMGNLMVNMLLAFAEFEHDQIIERLNAGKAVAKAHGKRTDGRLKKLPSDFEMYYDQWREGKISVTEACKRMNICRGTWYSRVQELSTSKEEK